ncbi:MAG: protein kinase [Calditrichia bacterium]
MMIEKRISHYKILEKLGEGGMGVVYKAHDTRLDRLVALKFLPPHLTLSETDKIRFLQEARAAAALNHPHVCVVYEIDDRREQPFIAMELIEGITLREKLQDGPLDLKTVINYALQIAEALQAAHEKDIVHRDIKSENIMITGSGQAKIMDFGLARIRGATSLTRSSSTVGTIAYMPPEHLQGREVDARSDIFSFGVVLYEMLTGELPFKGEYDSAMMYSILNEEPEPVQKYRPGLTSEFLHILDRALEKDPENRYQTVRDMMIDLKRLKRDTGSLSLNPPPEIPGMQKPQIKNRSKKQLWMGLSALTILLLTVFWFLGHNLSDKNPQVSAVQDNSIAVMYFENKSIEKDFGKILVEMLTSNLSRCKQINVVSSQYLFDILKRMNLQDVEAIDRSIATDVAVNARVQSMLLGSIYNIGDNLFVNAQLCDVRSGKVIGAAQAQGSRVDDVFQMVNRLTEEVIALMKVSETDEIFPLRINDVTTHSFEAYKHYQKGSELIRRWNWEEGRKEFQKAFQIDSTFAMAHCAFAFSTGVFKISPLSDLTAERESMRLAKKYSQKATAMERSLIDLFYYYVNRDYDAYLRKAEELAKNYPNDKMIQNHLGFANYVLGNYPQAIQAYGRALEIDPEFALAQNLIAYCYLLGGEKEKAFAAARNYIALQPDVQNTYDSAFEIYLMAGRYEDAHRICDEALAVNPTWDSFRQSQSYIYLFSGEGEKAREISRNLAESAPSMKLLLQDDLGCFDMFEGRYKEAADEFRKVIDLARQRKNDPGEIHARLVMGKFYGTSGHFSKAYQEFSSVKSLSEKVYGTSYNTWPVRAEYFAGVTAINEGKFSRAREAADWIRNYVEDNSYDSALLDFYYLLRAEIHLKLNDSAEALSMLNKVSHISSIWMPHFYRLNADIMASQGEIDKALQVQQRLHDDWRLTAADFFDYFLERSMSDYHTARLFEKKGEIKQAVIYYEKALERWKNADDDLPALINIKARLSALKGI